MANSSPICTRAWRLSGCGLDGVSTPGRTWTATGSCPETVMSTQLDSQGLQQRAREALRANWKMLLVRGILLLILGAIAIVLPPVGTLAVTFLLGWLFLIS